MSLTRLTSAKKHGFGKKHLRVKRDPPRQTALYMKQKSSFFVAVLSLVAFVTGNMVGQHGWYAFMKAALGQFDDSLITYTGTVPPIGFVPDYERWATYGGSPDENTYRQVPADLLIPLPSYDSKFEQTKDGNDNAHIYSVAYMGDYSNGVEGKGSHPGVDIRLPEGTPIRSIANGIVTSVHNDTYGFGQYIVVRHPHMPDPDNKQYETVLHSSYSHLSAQLVQVGDIVQKGQLIGYSGSTGDASGPHLHFQIDRDTAPWHPYWPFTGAETRAANLNTFTAVNSGFHQDRAYQYTVNPMLIAQGNLPPAKFKEAATVASNAKHVTTSAARAVRVTSTLSKSTVATRRAQRLSQQRYATNTVQKQTIVSGTQSPSALAPAPVLVVAPEPASSTSVVGGAVHSIEIQSARQFIARQWQSVRLTLLDVNGSTASTEGLPAKLYMRTAYGDAEFQPSVLTPAHFRNGTAMVQMLPRGRQTIVIQIQPLAAISDPIRFGGE